MTQLNIPHDALVLLVGPAGAGKSTFAAQHFHRTEVVSSDACREMVSDSVEDMRCSPNAFELFYTWIQQRLRTGRLTVADSTALSANTRTHLRSIAGECDRPVVIILFDTPLELCKQQNNERLRYVPDSVIEGHHDVYQDAVREITMERYHARYRISPRITPVEVRIYSPETPPVATGYDVIGDVHGCYDELKRLVMDSLGYVTDYEDGRPRLLHRDGRKLIFVGDYTDRGPKNVDVLRFVANAVSSGHHAVVGNHDDKLSRWLLGNDVRMTGGLKQTAAELEALTVQERAEVREFLSSLPCYLRLSVPGTAELVVCHAGMPKTMLGRLNREVRSQCLYGERTGEMDSAGFPVRGDTYVSTWSLGLDDPWLVHGHTVIPDPSALLSKGKVINVDQGCVFGGKLTAFRYPETKFYHVAAEREYITYSNKRV